MAHRTIEDRITKQLDRLEDPNLSGPEIEKIKQKIDLLQSMKAEQE